MEKMPFGKYKGQSLLSIAEEDPQYLTWILKNTDITAELEMSIGEALHEADTLPAEFRESDSLRNSY